MKRPVLLDAFCGAGGAAKGYQRAGFDVIGVDINPQPRYVGDFVQGDALEFIANFGSLFDAIHASPPCQAYSITKKIWARTREKEHPDLLAITRDALVRTGRPFVIENVPLAPMRADLILCGTMFGLGWNGYQLFRHRLFESGGGFNLSPFPPATCGHQATPISVFGHGGEFRIGERRMEGGSMRKKALRVPMAAACESMGIDWMKRSELVESIPPAYTEFIGKQLMRCVGP